MNQGSLVMNLLLILEVPLSHCSPANHYRPLRQGCTLNAIVTSVYSTAKLLTSFPNQLHVTQQQRQRHWYRSDSDANVTYLPKAMPLE